MADGAVSYARRLGLFSGTMAVVGGIIGGGIFRTPATVAERVHTPGMVLVAWVVMVGLLLQGIFTCARGTSFAIAGLSICAPVSTQCRLR